MNFGAARLPGPGCQCRPTGQLTCITGHNGKGCARYGASFYDRIVGFNRRSRAAVGDWRRALLEDVVDDKDCVTHKVVIASTGAGLPDGDIGSGCGPMRPGFGRGAGTSGKFRLQRRFALVFCAVGLSHFHMIVFSVSFTLAGQDKT